MRLSAELRREPPLPNRYLEFGRSIRGKYEQAQGYGGMSLLYASQEKEEEPEEKPWQTQITNYYKLQYLHQENVLYQQRLSFLTEILEKRLSQTVYSSVERQIDRLIKEELDPAQGAGEKAGAGTALGDFGRACKGEAGGASSGAQSRAGFKSRR